MKPLPYVMSPEMRAGDGDAIGSGTPFTVIVLLLAMPPATVLPTKSMALARFAELALIVPVLAMPPPIVLLFTKSATVVPKGPTGAPGVIVPALVTAPVTEVPVIEMKLVVAPAGLVTEACGVVMVSPAFAGAARRSATSEVVAKSEA